MTSFVKEYKSLASKVHFKLRVKKWILMVKNPTIVLILTLLKWHHWEPGSFSFPRRYLRTSVSLGSSSHTSISMCRAVKIKGTVDILGEYALLSTHPLLLQVPRSHPTPSHGDREREGGRRRGDAYWCGGGQTLTSAPQKTWLTPYNRCWEHSTWSQGTLCSHCSTWPEINVLSVVNLSFLIRNMG